MMQQLGYDERKENENESLFATEYLTDYCAGSAIQALWLPVFVAFTNCFIGGNRPLSIQKSSSDRAVLINA